MLEKELAFFESNRENYCKVYLGQFVLIHENTFCGSFTTQEQAYEAGIKRFGNVPFLIKCVVPSDMTANAPAYTIGILRN